MTAKSILLTGRIQHQRITLNIAPRQETLHRCPVCLHKVSRNDMRIVNGIFVCVSCAEDDRDESEEE